MFFGISGTGIEGELLPEGYSAQGFEDGEGFAYTLHGATACDAGKPGKAVAGVLPIGRRFRYIAFFVRFGSPEDL